MEGKSRHALTVKVRATISGYHDEYDRSEVGNDTEFSATYMTLGELARALVALHNALETAGMQEAA